MPRRIVSIKQLFILFLPFILAGGCVRSHNPDVERGANYKFRQGYPEVRLSVLSSWNENLNTHLEVTADIVYGSLFYKRELDRRRADLAIRLIITDTDKDSTVYATRFSYDKVVEDVSITESQDVFTFRERYQVLPGTYRVELTLTDQHTGKKTTRLSDVIVPNITADASYFSNIRLYAKNLQEQGNSWYPITTYDIPSRIDSLKLTYQVNNKSENSLTINADLIRFKADTTPAISTYTNNYNPSSLPYKGVNYGEEETIQSNRRTLPPGADVTVDLKLSMLNRGNYRYEIRGELEGEGERQLFKARDFSIKSPYYPTLKTARELARPLVYLMDKDEYRELMDIDDPDLLKQEVDKFWLRNIGNRNDAKTVISLYYSRVEQANKLFSNFKEGWKTDRGMIYILFGAPLNASRLNDILVWSYSHNRSDPNLNYSFLVTRNKSEYFPFDHFILRRKHSYYQMEYRQKQLWLSGSIMLQKL